jgi:hypothetical protein
MRPDPGSGSSPIFQRIGAERLARDVANLSPEVDHVL